MFSSGKRLEILSFDIDYFLFYSADADIRKKCSMKNTPLSHFSPFLIFLALSFCFALVLSGLVRFLFFFAFVFFSGR